MKVFLLGAGASKSFDASPSKQRMPIARDFFPTFLKLSISGNPWVLQEGLITYLWHQEGVADARAYLTAGVDIEALHSEIESVRDRFLSGEVDTLGAFASVRAYNELVFLFAATINEIQNGPISEPHLRLVERLSPDDAVITFNWDTLLDRALAVAKAWAPDWGYGLTPQSVFENGWRQPGKRPPGAEAPRLVKLHGSTNWLTAYPILTRESPQKPVLSHDLDPSAFSVFVRGDDPYPCHAGRYMAGYGPYSYGYYPPNLDFPGRPAPPGYALLQVRPKVPWRAEGSSGDGGLVSMPLIIPPVKHKTYDMYGDLFGGLWREAEDLLAQADTIIVIGYSFPPTDLQADHLFRRAFGRRKSMPQVIIVDPMPARVADKFRFDLGMADARLDVRAEYFTAELAAEL